MEYKASLDWLAGIITFFVFVILYSVIKAMVGHILDSQEDAHSMIVHILIIAVLVFVVAGVVFYAPQKYLLNEDGLVIVRPGKNRTIRYEDIAEVFRMPDASFFPVGIRLFGSGGMFGYFGKFHNFKYGTFTAYATKRHNRIMLRTKSAEQILITPDDIRMADEIKKRLPAS